MDERAIRNSFQNVKRDIEEIKYSLKAISEKLSGSQEKKPTSLAIEKKDNKIFTSKVTVTQDMRDAVNEVFDSGVFTSGSKVKEFEKKFSEYCGVKHSIAVTNGTVSIEVILRCLGIGPGDEVIVPSHTTMPTVEPILHVGATPVFADISEDNYNLNPKDVERKITKKTKAILAVHLYGNSFDLEKMSNICKKHKIYLIEDCAQAHGAKYKGKHVGSFGIASSFSFYPTKNLTVCGEGGMIVTNDDAIAKKARMLISHGEEGRYNHVILGNNYRLSEIHCAVGIKQLELLNRFVARRRAIAKVYDKAFKGIRGIALPKETKNSEHSYHLYVVRVDSKIRDKVIEDMKEKNVFLGIHYPTPAHKQPVITNMMNPGTLKVTEKISKEIISLPIYPELSDSEARMVAENLIKIIKKN